MSVLQNEDNSLQLFESASVSETNREGDHSPEAGSRPTQNTLNKKESNKKLNLNLEGIDDISDCDVDSIKNTSARAITFHQFEQTKNIMKEKDGENQTTENNDLNNSHKMKEKLNQSHLELITSGTELPSA